MKESIQLEEMLSPAFKVILDSFLKNPDNKLKFDKVMEAKLKREKESK